MKKSAKKYLFWIIPLILPLIVYGGIEWYENNTLPPIISKKIKNKNGKKVYETVNEFTLVDQKGKPFSSQSLQGKIYVANFFFASCPVSCPKMNAQVQRIHKKFNNKEDLEIISFSVNPKNDTPEVLNDYAQRFNADYNQWKFLTGSKKVIYRLARNSFKITAAKGDGGSTGFIHSNQLILVDRKGRLRGYYDGREPDEVNDLMQDIKQLLNKNKNA